MMYLGNDPVGLATSIPTFAQFGKVEMGEYTPETDVDPGSLYVSHSLGEQPDFLYYYSDTVDSLASDEYSYMCFGVVSKVHYKNGGVDPNTNALCSCLYTKIGSTSLSVSETPVNVEDFIEPTRFRFAYKTTISSRLKANITYHYIIGKFKEVT